MANIGENIKKYRKMNGFTQKKLGQLIGASDVMIRHYELGIRTPKKEKLLALSKALNVDTYSLTVPEIDSSIGVVKVLLELDKTYGLKLEGNSGAVYLTIQQPEIQVKLKEWLIQENMYAKGIISEEEFTSWKNKL